MVARKEGSEHYGLEVDRNDEMRLERMVGRSTTALSQQTS